MIITYTNIETLICISKCFRFWIGTWNKQQQQSPSADSSMSERSIVPFALVILKSYIYLNFIVYGPVSSDSGNMCVCWRLKHAKVPISRKGNRVPRTISRPCQMASNLLFSNKNGFLFKCKPIMH